MVLPPPPTPNAAGSIPGLIASTIRRRAASAHFPWRFNRDCGGSSSARLQCWTSIRHSRSFWGQAAAARQSGAQARVRRLRCSAPVLPQLSITVGPGTLSAKVGLDEANAVARRSESIPLVGELLG